MAITENTEITFRGFGDLDDADKPTLSGNVNEFLTPGEMVVEEISPIHAQVTLEPLERGFGHTIGNALRRILLSSMPGASIVEVEISGAEHEFATLKGVQEDVLNITQNLKGVAVKLLRGTEANLELSVTGSTRDPKVVTAADFKASNQCEIMNPTHHICTLNSGARIYLTAKVSLGRGYEAADRVTDVPVSSNVGALRLDASYSPMRRVGYRVENTRVEQRTDLDKLILDVETNGTIEIRKALSRAATILIKQLEVLQDADESDEITSPSKREERNPYLNRPIDDLGLSVRATNCLKAEDIKLVVDLVQKDESSLLRYPNLGKKSLDEIKEALALKNLKLDTKINIRGSASIDY